MSLHCIVWYCMVLHCWVRRAGCISQDTYLLYNYYLIASQLVNVAGDSCNLGAICSTLRGTKLGRLSKMISRSQNFLSISQHMFTRVGRWYISEGGSLLIYSCPQHFLECEFFFNPPALPLVSASLCRRDKSLLRQFPHIFTEIFHDFWNK